MNNRSRAWLTCIAHYKTNDCSLENCDGSHCVALQTALAHGAYVIDASKDRAFLWEKTDRYGSDPEEAAFNIVKEWNAKGEPDIRGWDGIAFATQEWLDSSDNRRD